VAAVSTRTRPAAATPPDAPPPRGRGRRRAADRWLPYGLLAPALLLIGAVLGYPLAHLVLVSLQHYKLRELLRGGGTYVGLDNYRAVLGDPFFWTVVLRTVVFTAVAVAGTVVLSTAIALLMTRMHRAPRIVLQSVLVMVWAMPALVAIAVWQWLFDFDFGVVNWGLTRLGFSSFTRHNWFADPMQGFAVILGLVVWAAIPFVAITLYAGFTQVPRELQEAARVDGAIGWRVFRHVTFPVVRPLYVIVTSLSIIWDFGVYQQVYVMLNGRPSKDYYLVGIYSFVESFGVNDYGKGSAIAVVMILLLLAACVVYIRQMIRLGDVR
jgi:N,N'-diacetylchitobiose transport system permease protein